MRRPKIHQLRPWLTTAVGLAATLAVLAIMGWSAALVLGVFVAAVGVVRYGLVGAGSYTAAILADRPDELHAQLKLQVRAGVAVVGLLGAVAAAPAARALGDVAWPFELVAGVGVASFLVGLLAHGDGGRAGLAELPVVLGRRADERQVELRLHALQLAAIAMTLASTAGLLAFAGRSSDRPFEILDVVLGGSFLTGLALVRMRLRSGTS